MKVAFVHDWLVSMRGGEKVLEALLSLYPDAPIYTLFYDHRVMPDSINDRRVVTPKLLNSFRRLRKASLPVLPRFIETFNLDEYDLIVSTSSCVAKGVNKSRRSKHLCYLHSPMRYVWDQQEQYIQGVRKIPGAKWGIKAVTPAIRKWDIASSDRVDRFVVNSTFVGERCRDYYGRDSVVVHPPIDTSRFTPRAVCGERNGYLLAAGALVSYKRFDLAIQVCEALGRRLVIAGSGPMEAQLRQLAGPHTTFEIAPSDDRFGELLAGAQALLFPGVEDFGMIAVEAMASGTPVIAFNQGGARDFIQPGVTGTFFTESTITSLRRAIERFEPAAFDEDELHKFATQFEQEAFLTKMRAEIDTLLGTTEIPASTANILAPTPAKSSTPV